MTPMFYQLNYSALGTPPTSPTVCSTYSTYWGHMSKSVGFGCSTVRHRESRRILEYKENKKKARCLRSKRNRKEGVFSRTVDYKNLPNYKFHPDFRKPKHRRCLTPPAYEGIVVGKFTKKTTMKKIMGKKLKAFFKLNPRVKTPKSLEEIKRDQERLRYLR